MLRSLFMVWMGPMGIMALLSKSCPAALSMVAHRMRIKTSGFNLVTPFTVFD